MKQQLLLALALAPLATASADVLNVRGPNPDFNQINLAIAAASDGDVIRVWPGNYAAFEITGRSLTVTRESDLGTVMVDGSITISGLTAVMEAVVSGIDATGTVAEGLIVTNNQGAVRVEGGIFVGRLMDGTGDAHPGGRVATSADVAFTSCSFFQGAFAPWPFYDICSLSISGSSVSMFDSEAIGSDGMDAPEWEEVNGWTGSNGVNVSASFFYASGCLFQGGDGGDGGDWTDSWTGTGTIGGDGGDGIDASNASNLHLLDTLAVGGVGGWGSQYDGNPGEEVDLNSGSTLEDLVGTARHLDLPTLLPEQTTVNIVVEGQAGDLVLLVASVRSRLRYIAPAHGPLLLRSPFDMPRQILGYLPGSGSQTYQFTIPDVPPLAAITWHFQAGLIPSSGGLYLSSVRSGVLLDSAW